jgi:hypothetical protein
VKQGEFWAKTALTPITVGIPAFEVGRDRRARRDFLKSIFTEGRQGNEATGIGSHQISKQALLCLRWRNSSGSW